MRKRSHDPVSTGPSKEAGASDHVEWDHDVTGLGRRIRPSRVTWIVQSRRHGRLFKQTLGDAGSMSVEVARRTARDLLFGASITPTDHPAPRFETFIETFLHDVRARWEPTTHAHVTKLLQKLCATFGGRRIDAITSADVVLWFESQTRSANWSLSALSSLMEHAEALGHRPPLSNPCKGLRRKETTFKARYPRAQDYRALGRALHSLAGECDPVMLDAIRFLALTGARMGEALAMEWRHLHGDRVVLPDSKTGPKTIWLCSAAQQLLDRLPRYDHPFIFGPASRSVADSRLGDTWLRVRHAAQLDHLRLHDLRHGFASVAIQRHHDLRIVARLLSHADPETTLRYAHLAQRDVALAVGRVSRRLHAALERDTPEPMPLSAEEQAQRIVDENVRKAVRHYYGSTRAARPGESPRAYSERLGIDFTAFSHEARRYRAASRNERAGAAP